MKPKRFYIGDLVEIVPIGKEDLESYYYVQQFVGHKGEIFDITLSKKGIPSFHVIIGGKTICIFHENEIKHVTDDN